MADNSKIEWTRHTFNPWRGCTKISAGCANCYAETLSHRNPKTLGVWGDNGTRVIASESMWREPLKWDRLAKEAGERHRVFCASLADVFENRPELDKSRHRLFHLISQTKNLDWLLLTKRPENIEKCCGGDDGSYRSWTESPPPNVWLGVSVENRHHGFPRIFKLVESPATIRFLSVEPLLESLGDISSYLKNIDLVIVGGESGHDARPMHPLWVREIRNQCQESRTPFFFKQWGEFAPLGPTSGLDPDHYYPGRDKRISLHSGIPMDEPTSMFRVGKKIAGRMLDGRTWDEMPKATVPT